MKRMRLVIAGLVLVAFTGCQEPTENPESTPADNGTAEKAMPNTIDTSGRVMNVYEWGQAREILREAKALIERDGFQQGATEPIKAWCASTALEGAWLAGPYSIVDFNYARDALSRAIDVPREPEVSDEAGSPDVPYWGIHFVDWNDDPERTEEEVLAAFDDAVGIADEMRAAAEEEAEVAD